MKRDPTIFLHRDILTHQYFGIDFDLVWEVIQSDLPFLDTNIENILSELDE